jgi:hypothetical protein
VSGHTTTAGEKEAETTGKDPARWQTKVTSYAKEESTLQNKLMRAERSEGGTWGIGDLTSRLIKNGKHRCLLAPLGSERSRRCPAPRR